MSDGRRALDGVETLRIERGVQRLAKSV